jgi:hypothetical protein
MSEVETDSRLPDRFPFAEARRVVDYLLAEEREDYLANDHEADGGHIFTDVVRLHNWLRASGW